MWDGFQTKMKPFRVFSIADVEKHFPSINLKNPVLMQKKFILRSDEE
jgi:hypothetical protein